MRFENLNLNDNVLDALYDMHFDMCTPIQEKTIPEILKGHDVLGVAQTGTGKTAAYLLPILSKLDDGGYPDGAINCIIMSPTRELAQQIDQAMQGFGYYLKGVSSIAVYGGNDGNRYDQEVKSLHLGADMIIATPGRLLSHISLKNVDLSKVSFFVLDEADRMLDMGFSEDIKNIAKELPATCQTIMFSATMPHKIEDLAKTLLKNPVEIKLAVSKPAEKIKQSAYICYETQKLGIVKDIFKSGDLKRVIIFCGSKTKVKQVNGSLQRLNVKSGEMHSDLTQEERDNIMFKFKADQLDVLVATDIVARGIDIDDITMVINYDVPHDAEDYVHRIGRTARADKDGAAITLVNENEQFYFQLIEKFLEKEITKNPLPEDLGEGPEYNKHASKPQRVNNSAKNRRQKDRDYNAHKDKKQHSRKENSQEVSVPTNHTKNPNNRRHNPQYRDESDKKGNNRNHYPNNRRKDNGNNQESQQKEGQKQQNRAPRQNNQSEHIQAEYTKRRGNVEGNYKKRQNTTKGTQNRTNRPQHESTLTPAKDKGIKKFIKKLFGFKK